jgi:chemotaxis-related protein WspD
VFPVDEVEQVYRLPHQDLSRVPATVGRAVSRLTRGVFAWNQKSVGLLDVDRLFVAVRGKIQ